MALLWIFIIVTILSVGASSSSDAVQEMENLNNHMFLEPMQNVTVAMGREAVFTCIVENAENFKVAFLSVDTQTILTIDSAVITRSSRINLRYSVDRDETLKSGKRKTWQLVVKEVHQSDAGAYMCQLNTVPMAYQQAFLHVTVPPDILANESSSDVTVSEGQNATLRCSASGYPEPNVTWRREDYQVIYDNRTIIDGPVLDLIKIRRHQMASYLCIASNGVPPPVSRRIIVRVEFAPELITYQSNVTVHFGEKLELHCQCSSWPPGRAHWTNHDRELPADQESVDQSTKIGAAVTNINLRIPEMKHEHQGDYTCHCTNRRGVATRTISVRGQAPEPVQQKRTAQSPFRDGHQEDEQSPTEAGTTPVTLSPTTPAAKRKKPEKAGRPTTAATMTTTTTSGPPVVANRASSATIRPLQHQQPKNDAGVQRPSKSSSTASHSHDASHLLLYLFLLIILCNR